MTDVFKHTYIHININIDVQNSVNVSKKDVIASNTGMRIMEFKMYKY